jgi:cobaltochelatase CobN
MGAFVQENSLLSGRTVVVLYAETIVEDIEKEGGIFDPETVPYFMNSTIENWRNIIRLSLNRMISPALDVGPPDLFPATGVFHPEADDYFLDYTGFIDWYKTRPNYDENKPFLGLMFFTSALAPGQREALGELILKLEEGGFNVMAPFGHDIDQLNTFLLDSDNKARVEIVLAISLKFHLAFDEEMATKLAQLNVPLINALPLTYQNTDLWRESLTGVAPLAVIWALAISEVAGTIEPTPIIGRFEMISETGGGSYYQNELIEGQLEFLLPRLHAWVDLRRKENSEKKIAILYYNHSPGKGSIGASYLNVFESLSVILASMKEAGYSIDENQSFTEETLKDIILKAGRNVGSWAPGELQEMLETSLVQKVPLAQYEQWFAELPQVFQDRVLEYWGPPANSKVMFEDGNFIIPAIFLGDNIVIMPEPARGEPNNAQDLYHDPKVYPHHQYICAYLWIHKAFNASAMIHLGTHATHEWLPGKQAGLSYADPSEVLIGNVPNVYPYIVDNIAEGTQAKRRGRGDIIDHLTPAIVPAEGYEEYITLSQEIDAYLQAESLGSSTAQVYLEGIEEMAVKLGLSHDLALPTGFGPNEVEELKEYLEGLTTTLIPFGLHTFGQNPPQEEAQGTAQSVVSAHPDVDPKDIENRIMASGPLEIQYLLSALSGGYVPSGEGNDPIRNPDSLPTGRNFYGIAPNKIPSKAAWELGQKAADDIIETFRQANEGRYPNKVGVVLWAIETLRNEGVNEATILALVGVEPIWSSGGSVMGTRAIRGSTLGRPRIDVTIDASGLFRDMFPDKLVFIDKAIRQAAAQDDIENFISQNDRRIEETLLASGMDPAEASRFSRARVFSEAPGTYGIKVSTVVEASGMWDDPRVIGETYRKHISYAYGEELWGEPAAPSLDENLRDVELVYHSSSSNLYGLMDNDDMYMYLGGLSMATRDVSGKAPMTLILDQKRPGEAKIEDLARQLGTEMRSRYFNPKWIDAMMAEDYAGAREMSHFVEYLWGWDATVPESVDETAWDQTYEVYVRDKYELGIQEFLDKSNPWASQSISARMLETARKGYWDPTVEVKTDIAKTYVQSVLNNGLSCSVNTCQNPQLHSLVIDLVSVPGVMPLEDIQAFKDMVEKAAGMSLEDYVAAREELIRQQNAQRPPNPEATPVQDETQTQDLNAQTGDTAEDVRGLKMEKVDQDAQGPKESSGFEEWLVPLFVLIVICVFYVGYRFLGRKKEGH